MSLFIRGKMCDPKFVKIHIKIQQFVVRELRYLWQQILRSLYVTLMYQATINYIFSCVLTFEVFPTSCWKHKNYHPSAGTKWEVIIVQVRILLQFSR